MLTVAPEVNVARVATRVASGGHDVEKSKIIERYYKAVANIPQLMELCDILHIYDNTITPVRIVRKHKDDISIFPNDLWPEAKVIELIGEWDTPENPPTTPKKNHFTITSDCGKIGV